MSLDVYLMQKEVCEHCGHETGDGTEVYTSNITHNLSRMADAAGIYKHLWHPDDLGIERAGELIEPLTEGLRRLKDDPAHFKQFNASNGWGLYEHLVPWVSNYLSACKEYPNALISVSR